MSFKENLKSELSYKNMLVKELATLTEISKNTLDNYLNVRGYMPSADVAVKIAQALGVTVEYLVTGEDISTERLSQNTEIKELVRDFKQLSEGDREVIKGLLNLLKKREKTSKKTPKH
jgi:transcriptional regulator with XRE-family HTH domain